MQHKIAVIPGDGIGPEVTQEALKVIAKVKPLLKSQIQFDTYDLGAGQYLRTKEAMPASVFKDLSASDAVLSSLV